ncbi:hypothetical protein CVIRNUC_001139 [Coccomyxa viridis]|uniref:J domain-containing protein n=1 Tax=Coccomyxa viridis TaxID=1274662 RepID=A0AAV1HV84_9CHLO|nr:hypothetical protein CVIRNUC_001139 [Coccomyxa viridis]
MMLGPTSKPFKQSSTFGLPCATKQGCRATQLSPRIKITPRKALLCTASLDPWKTLGVAHDADDADIKKAYRKLVLQHHPDLKGSQAATRFVKIQEAYEVVTGKRRGSTVEETKQAAKTGTWDFHDWYWKFTASKRWDQQSKKKPVDAAQQAARPTGAPEQALQEQLAGLRRKAAFRRASRRAGSSAAQETSCAASGAPTSSSAQCSGSAPAAEAQDAAYHSSAGSSHSAHASAAASWQLAGLRRRAALRVQTQQSEDTPAPSDRTSASTEVANSHTGAGAERPPSSHIRRDTSEETLQHEPAVITHHAYAAAAATAEGSAPQDRPGQQKQDQEANSAVPWRRQHTAQRSSFGGASAFRVAAGSHPLAEIDIVKCMREITNHFSCR